MEKAKRIEEVIEEKLWNRSFLLLVLLNFVMFMGFQILMPVLPVYARLLGGNEATAGLVVGIFTISAVVVRPFIGKALDVFGRKKIFLVGFIFFCIFSFSYTMASSVLILLLLRFFHGFGWGTSSTTANTVASDIIPHSRLGEGMGFFGLTSTLAMAIAPALGLYMIQNSSFGFNGVFIFSAIAFLAAMGLSLGIRYPVIHVQPGKSALFEKSAFRSAMIVSLLTMSYGAIVTFIALYAQQQGIANIGPFFTVYALALMISRPLFGRLSDRKGFGIAVVPGLFGIMLALLLLSQAKTLSFFLSAGAVYGLCFGAVMPALQAMSVRKVPPHRRGAASATYTTGFDLGIGLGSIVLGTVAQFSGYSRMYLWAILPVLLALIIFFLPSEPNERL